MSLTIVATSQARSLSSSQGQSAEQETLRKMTEQYASAITAATLEAIRELWNPQSRSLAARMRAYQNLVSEVRIEFIAQRVTIHEITSDSAVTMLIADELCDERLRTAANLEQRCKIDNAKDEKY